MVLSIMAFPLYYKGTMMLIGSPIHIRQNPLCVHIWPGAVARRSTKQSIIARSTMESEFIALELASSEAKWLKNFLVYIPLGMKPTPSVPMQKP